MPSNIVGLHQMHPPGCQCGCGGNWGCDSPEWGSDLMQCWNQINQLKCLIKQIMDEVGGPIRTGPIRGVVDGSDAKPGEVGEYFSATGSVNYAAYPAVTDQVLSVGVVAPGDWDLWVSVGYGGPIGAAGIGLTPRPTGISNGMSGWYVAPGDWDQLILIGQTARGSFSVPTLMPFSVHIDQSLTSGLPAGTATLYLEGRRRR